MEACHLETGIWIPRESPYKSWKQSRKMARMGWKGLIFKTSHLELFDSKPEAHAIELLYYTTIKKTPHGWTDESNLLNNQG